MGSARGEQKPDSSGPVIAPHSRLGCAIGVSLVVFLCGWNLYRAHTQSIVFDEGLTYIRHVAKGPLHILSSYDANNHILNSLLAWISVSAFGLSELALRLPVLLGGALYLASALRL